jgi:UDP-glucose 4-epimerase
MKKQILVTGGTGYIGSHTVVELQEAGYDVIIIDDLSNSTADVVDHIETITGLRPTLEVFNLQDADRLEAFFLKYPDIEAIIHFAASKAVGESVEKPLLYYRNNLVSLMNLLERMPKHQVPNFVFSSSCTVYGQPDVLPVTEDTPRKEAESPYGNTKAVAEDIIRDCVKAMEGINAIALRYFNPIGAHPSSLIGELPRGVPNNLVPFITQTAAGLREKLSIFGDDYNTPDGTAIRDYINVVDLAKAHVVAIERLLGRQNDVRYEFFNIGTGKGASVLELVKTFMEVTGVNLNYQIVGRRAGDIEQTYADTTKANQVLGWQAEKSLGETLLSAWNWEKRVRNIT